MASDTRNVRLGVCQIKFGGYDLGYTKGGVEIEVKTETKKIMVDQFGNSEINEYILGRTCMVKVPMAETTLYNLVEVMPGATLAMSGGAAASATITFATLPTAATTVTVNGVVFTARATAATAVNAHEFLIGATVTETATNLTAAINSAMNTGLADISATSSAGVVTLVASTPGTAGNAFTLATTTGATLSGATFSGGVAPGRVKVSVPVAASTSLLSFCQRLVLHPISAAVDDRSMDFTIPLATTSGEMSYAFKLDEERIYIANFYGYPDPATGLLFVVGDERAA